MKNTSHRDIEVLPFLNGSAWIRADFHLHTAEDKEFAYEGNQSDYISTYVDTLKAKNIRVGVIANHNKFRIDEFKHLRKSAKRQGIFLLPGVEFTAADGQGCIHVIIVFSPEWIETENHIERLLSHAWPGTAKEQYENHYPPSQWSLLELVDELDVVGKDYFLTFAHVEQKSGLWKELGGARLEALWQADTFSRRSLAFQKVRTHDERKKVQEWLGQGYPAEVEGSDCKSIDEIGKGQPGYLRIGAFEFEAVKYALQDCKSRVAESPVVYQGSFIREASFEGGVLDGRTIPFSPELNTLIGVRGSGKSSILEALRYCLDIPFGDNAEDDTYKTELVEHTLGSGGKVTIRAVDQRGQDYEIRRIWRQRADVYVDGRLQPGVSIRETVLHKPLYFGQKDLSRSGEGFERDLVEKLIGDGLSDVRERIDTQQQTVLEAIAQLRKLEGTDEDRREAEATKQDAEYRLTVYKQHGVEARLKNQVAYDADVSKCGRVLSALEEFTGELAECLARHEDELSNQRKYSSEMNGAFFSNLFADYDEFIRQFDAAKAALVEGRAIVERMQESAKGFEKAGEGLKEEFARVRRQLAEELRETGAKAVSPEEFRQLRRTVDQTAQLLTDLEKRGLQWREKERQLREELGTLNELWREEYRQIEGELERVNAKHNKALKLTVAFKGDRKSFVAYMKSMFRGNRIRESTYAALAEAFPDFATMFGDMDAAAEVAGSASSKFIEHFQGNLEHLLTWRPPNSFTIEYRGKELKHHSLGQRASALIIFLLSQEENDLILIDQPEDDLDNQTIYEDVIKMIREMKPRTQFIFATHNGNFPVLGDADQVVSCTYSDDRVDFEAGSIDEPTLQQTVVDVMEGGEEAFDRRKRIYETWRPRGIE